MNSRISHRISGQIAALLALFWTSWAMAATVTITPSTATPTVGNTFTLTVTADVGNTFAATMALAFDATKVQYVTGAALSPWTVFTKNSPTSANPTVFDVEAPSATAPSPATYDVAILTFMAIAAGNANIVINDDGGNASGWFDATTADYIPVTYTQATVTVTAFAPNIAITDTVAPNNDRQVPFGSVTEGVTSSTQTVTVTNSGNQNLVLGTLALANPLAAPFTVVSDNCSGMTLTPSSSCAVGIEFSPVSSGAFTDSFDILSNDPDESSVTVQVTGTGTAALVPNIAVTDAVAPTTDHAVPFSSVVLNVAVNQTLTVANTGTANLTLGVVAMANPLVAPFSVLVDNCSNQVLAPTQTCTVQIRFQPTVVGAVTDSLDFPSDDPDTATVTVAVSGTGAPVPVPNILVTDSVSPTGDLIVAFGDVRLPNLASGTVTVTNDGTASLVLGTVASVNPLAAPFSKTADTCSGQTLAPNGTCTITVVFTPDAIQPYNESFDIPSNDPDDASVTVAVSGNGMPASTSSGGSAVDPGTLLLLGLAGLLADGRRRRASGTG